MRPTVSCEECAFRKDNGDCVLSLRFVRMVDGSVDVVFTKAPGLCTLGWRAGVASEESYDECCGNVGCYSERPSE